MGPSKRAAPAAAADPGDGVLDGHRDLRRGAVRVPVCEAAVLGLLVAGAAVRGLDAR